MRMKKIFFLTPPKNPHEELDHIESFGGNYFGKYSKEKLHTPTRWQIMLNLYSTIVDRMLNHKCLTSDPQMISTYKIEQANMSLCIF
jgi:hypothetical protein